MVSGEGILSLLPAFIFSFFGVQSSGDTDINPISTVAKASQIVFGGLSKGSGASKANGQLVIEPGRWCRCQRGRRRGN